MNCPHRWKLNEVAGKEGRSKVLLYLLCISAVEGKEGRSKVLLYLLCISAVEGPEARGFGTWSWC